MWRRFRDMLTGPQGHVCPTAKAHNVLLRALCEYVDRRMLAHASDTACQVAIMEAHDELCTRAESAEAALRTLLGAHMNVELPADFPIEADIVMLKLLSWRGAGSVQG